MSKQLKKKIFSLIAVVAIVIIFITTVSILSLAVSVGNDGISKYKQILLEMMSDKTISKEDRDQMKALLDMPQWFNSSLDITEENTELDNNFDSYNIIIKYLITLIENYPERDHICLGVDGGSKESIVLSDTSDDGGVLNITEEVSQALYDIDESFSKLGYIFDAIRIKNGIISFDTIDGVYSLIYKIDDNADVKKEYEKEDSIVIIESNRDNWYHKVMS